MSPRTRESNSYPPIREFLQQMAAFWDFTSLAKDPKFGTGAARTASGL
jgi:hypothetical protein